MAEKTFKLISRLHPFLWGCGFVLILAMGYGRLIFHPGLHTACPENDTWNLPVRYSVIASLQKGVIPLWNPLSAFGIPWLATWATEVFYPGTFLFDLFGLSFWNFSGLLHLLIFSIGLFVFLKKNGVSHFWAFLAACLGALNGCAYNHIGSNAPMDTMAWIPWVFVVIQDISIGEKWGGTKLALFLTLQILAGYPQTILYTLWGVCAYAVFENGWFFLCELFPPLLVALCLSACQWVPSVEYFLFDAVRLPAIPSNPSFLLPFDSLKTFYDFNALGSGSIPDYVVSPTYFFFNFYSGPLVLLIFTWGLLRWKKLRPQSRFFMAGFAFWILWALGLFHPAFHFFHLPLPVFLEPAKDYIVVNFFELVALGLLFQDLIPNPGKWRWVWITAALIFPLWAVWNHPLESNLIPPNSKLEMEARKIETDPGTHRLLVLPDAARRGSLYTPLPASNRNPFFKHFIPNSNLYEGLSLANAYSSTWPSWGSLDAQYYFKHFFPYDRGGLMDLLGVDSLLFPTDHLSPHFKKIFSEDGWTLFRNPRSVGSRFFFSGTPQKALRPEIFQAFSLGAAKPLETLYLGEAVSDAPLRSLDPTEGSGVSEKGAGYWIFTQNALPGWRAWVDGKPSKIYLADGIFQCVPVPAGASRIRLRYEPASFRLGLFVSLLGIAFGLGLSGYAKFKFFPASRKLPRKPSRA